MKRKRAKWDADGPPLRWDRGFSGRRGSTGLMVVIGMVAGKLKYKNQDWKRA
jgi:hypothetical protein